MDALVKLKKEATEADDGLKLKKEAIEADAEADAQAGTKDGTEKWHDDWNDEWHHEWQPGYVGYYYDDNGAETIDYYDDATAYCENFTMRRKRKYSLKFSRAQHISVGALHKEEYHCLRL